MRSILLGLRRRRGGDQRTQTRLLLLLLVTILPSISALDFVFNSFNASSDDLITLVGDAQVESTVLRLTNDSNQFSFGRAFLRSRIQMRPTSNLTAISSFSTSFVFSIVPEISTSPGFGLLFVLSNSTDPAGALSGQYLGIFSNATVPTAAPLIAVEFDVGRNPEFNDPDNNHVGIDLNNIESAETATAGYYNSTAGDLIPVNMRNGQNIHAWIEFDGPRFEINVTIAPIGVSRPSRPLLTFRDPVISNYLSSEMFVGFSASKTTWVETQRVLAWSFRDNGVARDINTTNLPDFTLNSSSSSLSPGAIAGITIGSVSIFLLCLSISYWVWRNHQRKKLEDDEIEDWELEYWPHRFSYEELHQATNGFSNNELLGAGGFGRVYRGTLPNNTEVAVKCVSHDSKQGLREFMAEISSMGRLQHKNLVPMRGWCRKGNELLLVYDYMPNGSLNRWIFDKPKKLMNWNGRRKVLADVAEGLNYLHHGWDQVVIHRDIKSSNILLDGEMRGRLGDFGLAKLYTHGEVPNTTRVVGTLGYLAPELATAVAGPTAASDVYSFGVVVLEVACGRKPIETAREREEEVVLIDWVREKYGEGKVWEAADGRIKGEYKAEEMEAVLKLGLACCHPDPVHRPTMREVVAVLVGGEVATAMPRVLLSELAQGGSSIGSACGGGGEEVLLPEVPV
ncbi:Legume lectin domain protein [Actinidia chinensis var. chinensis]|uniref:non-specific serine/threonine protein kinase n=1 Tax=Actinidia chinensis var. chinensis TaxID=1590841 RepID=A0A2R6PDK8_ACTCC|nr:Legume lectin domain protein [Actinidia chinensis var. chinensis]